MADDPVVPVPVKSKWWSKVNWILLCNVLMTTAIAEVTQGTFGLDDATKVQVLLVLNVVLGTAGIIVKTWYTPGVIINSLPKDIQNRIAS